MIWEGLHLKIRNIKPQGSGSMKKHFLSHLVKNSHGWVKQFFSTRDVFFFFSDVLCLTLLRVFGGSELLVFRTGDCFACA